MRTCLRALVLSFALVVAVARPAPAAPLPPPPFTAVWAFGDSLGDTGERYGYLTVEIEKNTFSTLADGGTRWTNGPNWLDRLGASWRLTATRALGPDDQPGTADDGTVYAFSGATTGCSSVACVAPVFRDPAAPGVSDIRQQGQINRYLARTGGVADPAALYVSFSGVNNVVRAIDAADASARMLAAAAEVVAGVDALVVAGARHIMVPTIYNVGMAPIYAGDPVRALRASNLSLQFNTAVSRALGTLGFDGLFLYRPNFYGLFRNLRATPEAYGFTDSLSRCGGACVADGVAVSNPAYVWLDGLHPTTDAQRRMAALARSSVARPLLPAGTATAMGAGAADDATQPVTEPDGALLLLVGLELMPGLYPRARLPLRVRNGLSRSRRWLYVVLPCSRPASSPASTSRTAASSRA